MSAPLMQSGYGHGPLSSMGLSDGERTSCHPICQTDGEQISIHLFLADGIRLDVGGCSRTHARWHLPLHRMQFFWEGLQHLSVAILSLYHWESIPSIPVAEMKEDVGRNLPRRYIPLWKFSLEQMFWLKDFPSPSVLGITKMLYFPLLSLLLIMVASTKRRANLNQRV